MALMTLAEPIAEVETDIAVLESLITADMFEQVNDDILMQQADLNTELVQLKQQEVSR